MGVIYKAHDPDIDRPVAIKLVRADLLEGADRADYIARFRREAQAAGRCVHPNIVAVYDFALYEGNPFLAMEYVEGATLAQALGRGAGFTSAQSVALIAQVLDALTCAHGLGIVHRDIKPANVMLLADGRVKVTDFGISRLEGSDLTDAGSVIGTPSYMSPEQCLGRPVDERSDLFSTGAVLYELLAGARPFPGRTVAEITNNLLNAEPPDLTARLGSTPAVARVADRALAKHPAHRFGSAMEMRQALVAAIGGKGEAAAVQDGTVILPSPVATKDTPSHFDPRLLTGLERALARHVGPIARHLVQNAAIKAASAEELGATLVSSISNSGERTQFLQAVRALATTGSATGTRSGSHTADPRRRVLSPVEPSPADVITAAEADRAARALAHHLGPIAKVLVRRAMTGARSREALWAELAGHIDSPKDRRAFLRDLAD